MKLFLFLVCCLFVSLPLVVGMGVHPAKYHIPFTANTVVEGHFALVNDDFPSAITISPQGPWAPYVVLSETSFQFLPEEKERVIFYNITFSHEPTVGGVSTIPFFITNNFVSTIETQGTSESSQINVQLVLLTEAVITAPDVTKNLLLTPSIEKKDDGFHMRVTATNNGLEDIIAAQTKVTIYDQDQQVVTTVQSPVSSIIVDETVDLTVTPPVVLSLGDYTAHFTTFYDDKTTTHEQSFSHTTSDVIIGNLTTTTYEQGDYARFTVDVFNGHDETLPVQGMLALAEENAHSFTVNSSFMTMEPHTTNALDFYVNATTLSIGSYNSTVTLHYAGTSLDKTFITEITPETITHMSVDEFYQITREPSFTRDLFLIFLVLVLINILWFLYHSSRKHKWDY